ncbi:alanine/glycine:cation symporter family protein [Crocosphaera sp. UHCC 0190]|uniref:alanine/glycine:cation symporter family protein n=1 Tax=Crocosphaera sp. UHCC 0190 TaxID=3110246 RepID=UPI002B21B372|nr:alanine/glycine:cation symporter family protein [Crocosphaera sp. UHCC 0190]MEA5510299.1 alanine/glycine:cation symporter family protein [Crocosphaera sp. UHCC 0190]
MNQFLDNIDRLFSSLVTLIEQVLFFDIGGFPLIILWLLAGGIFFTLRMGLINIRGFKHALEIALGKYELTQEEGLGEVSSFQALATALSASVGLGNIAGVAIAIQLGGPGAVFWMTVAGFLGMSSKFVECTLGVKYRIVYPDGTIIGGPMYYLSQGLQELGQAKLGQGLAIFYSLAGLGSAVGGGNMFQANQSFAALAAVVPGMKDYDWAFGLLVALLVGLVIIGGISRIGVVTSKLVPLMVGIYLLACLWVLGVNLTAIPAAFGLVFQGAFSPSGVEGGMIGIFVQGIRRSAFSNGAGLGSAAIAHAVAKTKEPIREGIVAILEPFIDTILICNLTALVILTTGIYGDRVGENISGSTLATMAFSQVIDWFPFILVGIICLFGFSTMITWCYYGEQCWAYVFGKPSSIVFKILFLGCIFIGSVVNLGSVVNFSDMMLLTLAIPNLLGCMLLSGKVAEALRDYWQKLAIF